jgi:hypothetical protein
MVFGVVFLFMFTQKSFSFGIVQFSFLNINTYKLSKPTGWGLTVTLVVTLFVVVLITETVLGA